MIGIRRASTTTDRRTSPFWGWLGIGMLVFASGCAVCASPFDSHYPTYGGSWQRGHPSDGRVGSVFHPTGEVVVRSEESFVAAEGWDPADDGWRDEDDWGGFEGWGPPDVDWEGEDPALPEQPDRPDSPDWTAIMGE